jgi:NAD(P)-dependent dehydrogenase (short-subunit alcohol dehydrogenase family)
MEDVIDRFRLTGRTAIVTGGAGLLGGEFCKTLAAAGASVVILDIDSSGAEKIASTIRTGGGSSEAVGVDVTDKAAIERAVAWARERYGRVDVLVNSAALDPKFDPVHHVDVTNAFESLPLGTWNQALGVNLTGVFLTTQAVVPVMLEQGRGSIINLCSTYGLVGPDQRLYQREGRENQFKPVYYSVTKAGVLGFTRYLAAYYAGKNIRVNALTPGGVFADHDSEFVSRYSARTVLGRMAEQGEMNAALLFLASEASSYMTGSNLVVDGGWTAW